MTKAKIELKATEYSDQCKSILPLLIVTNNRKKKKKKTADMKFTDILSYASKLSKYTSAPPNFDLVNRDAKIDFEKPYPDEERMRRGLLYWQNVSQQPTEERCNETYIWYHTYSLFVYI